MLEVSPAPNTPPDVAVLALRVTLTKDTGTWLVESLLILLPIAAFQPVGSWASTRLSRATFQRVTLVLVAASAVSLAHNVVTGG